MTQFGGEEAPVYADRFDIYTGNANPDLARKICRYLGVELGKAEVFQFANENIFVQILDNVREKDVFLVQPTSHPVNQSIMELLIMIDAFKRASAGRITAVVPFYSYGRSDKKDQPRVPITARLIADMITVAGADRVLTMDLHQGQIQGFFNIPVDELTAVHILSNYFRTKHLEDLVVVTDLGFAKRARTFAELLDAPLAIIEKRRVGNLDRAELMNVIGEVRGKRAIIVDDEVDTGGNADGDRARARARGGQRDLRLRHPRRPVRPGRRADPRLEPQGGHPDRLDPAPRRPSGSAKIKTFSIAPLIGEAIKRIHRGESVGALFSSDVALTQQMLDVGGRCRPDARSSRDPTIRIGAPERPAGPGHADGRPVRVGQARRPMSLQLNRPDETGGLEKRPADRGWRLAQSPRHAALGRRPAQATPAGTGQPRDEPDVEPDGGRLLGRPGRVDVHRPVGRLRLRLLALTARWPARGPG